jgi:predicted acetyltransferase
VLIGDEALTIGLIGDVAVEPAFQLWGHAKHLIQAAHGFFNEASLPFSVLFAFEPERYRRSSGSAPKLFEFPTSRSGMVAP